MYVCVYVCVCMCVYVCVCTCVALVGVKERMSFMWVGWPGGDIDEADQSVVRDRLLAEHNSIPVRIKRASSA
jgi:hypothetical protein